jgi:hypothetical protein
MTLTLVHAPNYRIEFVIPGATMQSGALTIGPFHT